jgi:hypothetical protein
MTASGQDQSSECFGRMTGLSAERSLDRCAADGRSEPKLPFAAQRSKAALCQKATFPGSQKGCQNVRRPQATSGCITTAESGGPSQS